MPVPDNNARETRPPCPVCGRDAQVEAAFRDIVLLRCGSCDHCFTDVAALDYLGEYDEAWESLHPNWFENPNTALFELVRAAIDSYGPEARVIDVGSGRGELLAFLRTERHGLELTGLDVSLAPDIPGVEIVLADVTTFDPGVRRWDVVVSLATIEHVADVKAFASTLQGLLAPGGLVIVMTIDDRSTLYATARLLRRIGYRTAFERLYDRFHLNHFNTRSLRTLMNLSDFDVVGHHHHNIPLSAVDMPKDSVLLRAGVAGTFAVGRLTRRTYEQTIVCRRRPVAPNR